MDEHVGEVSGGFFSPSVYLNTLFFSLTSKMSLVMQGISCPAHKCDILVDEAFVG